jgi:molecular chaperone IbpA
MVTKYRARDLQEIVNNIAPFTIGFDHLFDNLNTVGELSNNYPPYNIVDDGDGKYTIEFAAAGFTEEELTITQVPDGNKLVVQGIQEKDDERTFVHKGIGGRNFTKEFALNQDVEVAGADFSDGILTISLEHIIPEERKPKTISINKQFLQD